jgi:hypothetical protein
MDLLRPTLPSLSIRLHGESRDFFDVIEVVATTNGHESIRDKDFAGPGSDLLAVRFAPPDSEPTARFIYAPPVAGRINCDVVDRWPEGGATHDTYVAAAANYLKPLLSAYRRHSGNRVRLSIGERDPLWDWDRASVNCASCRYAQEKLAAAICSLQLGPGDIHSRLYSAFMSFHVLQPRHFPAPLGTHFAWIMSELTSRPARHRLQGSVNASLAGMRKDRAVRIAERLVALNDALAELCP